MSIIIFTGPTLRAEDGRRVLDATFLPPASQGDVYRAARERPLAIGIIDGFFERVPAVWHKEILWAMDAGVHVFGSASMGALRAAELADLGMRGVGTIFESFHRGELEDDDEVTVVHAPAEFDYRPLSDAMVNIRATLAKAEREGIVSATTRERLLQLAKASFYPLRSYERLFADAAEHGVVEEERVALECWIAVHRIDQKRLDALQMLEAMAALVRDPEPLEVAFQFQHTDAWEQVRRQIDRGALHGGAGAETRQHDALLDELRLMPTEFHNTAQQALIRALALDVSASEGGGAGPDLLSATLDAFRRERHLEDPAAMQAWLDRESLTVEEFARLLEDEAQLRQIRTVYESDLDRHLADHLRLSGRYSALAERMERKHALLLRHGVSNPTLALTGLDEDAFWHWLFEVRFAIPVPKDRELFARNAGFRDADSLRRVAMREFMFERLSGEERRGRLQTDAVPIPEGHFPDR